MGGERIFCGPRKGMVRSLAMYLDSKPIPRPHCAALPIGLQSSGDGLDGHPPLGTAETPRHRIDYAIQPTRSTRVQLLPTYSQQDCVKHMVCHQHSMIQLVLRSQDTHSRLA